MERISLISLACGVFGPNADSLASSEAATAREGKRESGREREGERARRARRRCELRRQKPHATLLSPSLFPGAGYVEEIFPRMDYSTRARPQI